MYNKLDLRQIGTIYGHALYVDVADMPDFIETGEVLSRRDIEEYKVRTYLQEACGMPPSKATMIDEEPIIQTVCPVIDCAVVYVTKYSEELNNIPEVERKNVLKQARVRQEYKAKIDHMKCKHDAQ